VSVRTAPFAAHGGGLRCGSCLTAPNALLPLWAGSERVSNGKRKGRGNTKNGNKHLAWAFVEAANFAVCYEPLIKRFDQRKRAKSNGIVAIETAAHKLSKACCHILRDGADFDVSRAFAGSLALWEWPHRLDLEG